MKTQDLLHLGINFGIQHSIVKLILLKKFRLTKEDFFQLKNIDVSDSDLTELQGTFSQLAFGYPLEYILHRVEFYGFSFYVDERCLIPRDDTEVMVDQALLTFEQFSEKLLYIDVGTGSAAIPISVIHSSKVGIDTCYALDISTLAGEVAQKNLQDHNLEDIVIFKHSDLLLSIEADIVKIGKGNCVITANLPYIKDEDYGNIDESVIFYEPSVALYGGQGTGFEMYERLIYQILSLQDTCYFDTMILFIEIGFDQKKVAENFLCKKNLHYQIFLDNNGTERCIKIFF